MVAVNTLADFFRDAITAAPQSNCRAELILEHKGPGHTVFVYGKCIAEGNTDGNTAALAEPVNAGPGFLTQYPFYMRTTAMSEIEKIPVRLETIHGTSGFDKPGGAVLTAAKLSSGLFSPKRTKTGRLSPLLIHEPGQGFFPCWLIEFLNSEHGCNFLPGENNLHLVLSGRNTLALEAARHNAMRHKAARHNYATALPVPAADLQLGKSALMEAAGGLQYAFIAAFPELLPQSSLPKADKGGASGSGRDQLTALWESLPPLLCEGGLFLAAFSSSDAERFDRRKPPGLTRLGSIKRDGFRALAYEFRPCPTSI
jgi:hypothetical protein